MVVVVTRGGCEHFLRARANGRRCFFLSLSLLSLFLSLDDGEGFFFFNAMWSAVVLERRSDAVVTATTSRGTTFTIGSYF